MKIIAKNKKTSEIFEINDLYWFEENGVHSFNDDGFEFYFFQLSDTKTYSKIEWIGIPQTVNISEEFIKGTIDEICKSIKARVDSGENLDDLARMLARKILEAAKVESLGGCELCQG